MLLEDLYLGRVFPQESIVSKRTEYKNLCKEREILYNQLRKFINENQADILKEYTDTMYGICEEKAMAAFVYGVKFGMRFNEETK